MCNTLVKSNMKILRTGKSHICELGTRRERTTVHVIKERKFPGSKLIRYKTEDNYLRKTIQFN